MSATHTIVQPSLDVRGLRAPAAPDTAFGRRLLPRLRAGLLIKNGDESVELQPSIALANDQPGRVDRRTVVLLSELAGLGSTSRVTAGWYAGQPDLTPQTDTLGPWLDRLTVLRGTDLDWFVWDTTLGSILDMTGRIDIGPGLVVCGSRSPWALVCGPTDTHTHLYLLPGQHRVRPSVR